MGWGRGEVKLVLQESMVLEIKATPHRHDLQDPLHPWLLPAPSASFLTTLPSLTCAPNTPAIPPMENQPPQMQAERDCIVGERFLTMCQQF